VKTAPKPPPKSVPSRLDTSRLTCLICGSAHIRPAFNLPEFVVATCDHCGHGRTIYKKKPADTQARFQGARWTETREIMESTTSAMAELRYQDLAAFGPGSDVLEVGCGTGEFLAAAKRAGHRVVGLDLSEEAITYVQRRHPDLDVRCCTLDSQDLAPASFDVVAAFHVVEHVSDPLRLLQQMTRPLKPGGLLYIRVPNLNTWYRRVLGRNWWAFGVEHASHFTSASMHLALTETGLEVVTVRSGDSDLQHSMWPILPLFLHRGTVLRALGDALSPRTQGPGQSNARMPDSARIKLKRNLITGFLGYRQSATAMLAPLTRIQLQRGGGPELVAIARTPRA
jgi:2-polyprenyl-3-methyl-5-hydroxy-6-metoxy-1,4-benzoquinol methylase